MNASPLKVGNDLTSPRYWDRHWGIARDKAERPVGITAPERRFARSPLIRFLAGAVDRLGAGPRRVLEIGCAPGTVLTALQAIRPGHHYSGVDFSSDGIRDAHASLLQRGQEASLHHADARTFRPEQAYDLVFSCGLVEHFRDPADMIAHHRRLCVLGGTVLVSVPNYSGTVQEWFIRQLDPNALEAHNLAIMDKNALHDLFVSAGMTDVETGKLGCSILRSVRTSPSLKAKVLQAIARATNRLGRLAPPPFSCCQHYWAAGHAA